MEEETATAHRADANGAVSEVAPTSSRRVAINSMLQGGADAFGKVGQFFLYAVMAREAGIAAFGDFNSAASLTVLVLVVAFGMDFRVTRLIARREDGAGEAFWTALLLKIVLGILAAAVAVTVAAVGPYDQTVVDATALLGAAMVVELVTMSPQALFRGLERFKPIATALILSRGTLAIVGVALLLAGASVVAVAGAWLGSSLLALGYMAARVRASGTHLPRRVTRAGIRLVGLDSFGLGLAFVFGAALSRLDIVLLGLLKDSDAVALYGGAYRLMESVQLLTAALAIASFATMSRLTRTSSPTIGEATSLALKVVLIITAPIAAFFVVYAEPLMRTVYGRGFDGGAAALQLLAPTLVLLGISSIVTFVLTAQRRQNSIAVALGVATVVNLVLNLVLIPPHGAGGAAAAMIGTSVVMAVLLLPATGRVTGPLGPLRIMASPVLAVAAMIAVGFALGAGGVSVIPAFVAFAAVLFAAERLLYPADARRVLRALHLTRSN